MTNCLPDRIPVATNLDKYRSNVKRYVSFLVNCNFHSKFSLHIPAGDVSTEARNVSGPLFAGNLFLCPRE